MISSLSFTRGPHALTTTGNGQSDHGYSKLTTFAEFLGFDIQPPNKAGTYRYQEHDVLELEAKPLVTAYRNKIWLCPINSGCTKPCPHPRGATTFQRFPDYPYAQWKTKRPRGARVVELAVDYGVPDVAKFVKRVVRMKGDNEVAVLFEST
jgi:hypothetical protein